MLRPYTIEMYRGTKPNNDNGGITVNFPYRLSAALVGAAMVAVQRPFSVAVAQDVSTIAEAITVRIDGPKAGGSGVIVKREGNTYTVLSNWHVVDDSGNYVITACSGNK